MNFAVQNLIFVHTSESTVQENIKLILQMINQFIEQV